MIVKLKSKRKENKVAEETRQAHAVGEREKERHVTRSQRRCTAWHTSSVDGLTLDCIFAGSILVMPLCLC